jgi:MoaA/NifB/PqqE/SkfB family radical SAM enzyme
MEQGPIRMKYTIKQPDQYLLPETILNKYGCYRISRYIEIHESGDVSICCFSWLPKFFGNVLRDNPEQILENVNRLSLINDMDHGKFTECNDQCPYINTILNGKYIPGYIVPLPLLPKAKHDNPIVINFSYDRSCNLLCPSCRNQLILHGLHENNKLTLIHDKVKALVAYLLDNGEKLILNITGSGDPFASPTYWNYIKGLEYNSNLSLKLMTNGILMTESKWNEIDHLWNSITQINISLDAATIDTYAVVRKNGSLDKVKKNLEVLNELVKNGKFKNLKQFQTNFTVQHNNYKEVIEFAKWQLQYSHLNSIYFNLVVQWNHISDLDFQDIFELTVEEKKELSKLLKDPIFDNPKFNLGNLHSIKNL